MQYTYTIDNNKRKYQVLVSIDSDTLNNNRTVIAILSAKLRIYQLLTDHDIKYKGGYVRYGVNTILFNFFCERSLVTFKLLVE